jgi:aspartate carbamoyltransferase catalytic subunit
MNTFYKRDILSTYDISREEFELLFEFTDTLKRYDINDRLSLCKGKILGYLFFEPSTRTRLSFEVAMASLGGYTIGIDDIKITSIEKGESMKDTIRALDSYADIIVIRDRRDGSARFAAEIADNPVINAGSGMEEHPTQAMLDLYTMLKEKNTIDGLRIGIVGDLRYGRTVYSLLYALDKYDVTIDLISPKELKIRYEYTSMLKHKFNEYNNLEEIVNELDVIYITRIQKERFPDEAEYKKVKGSYSIDKKILNEIKEDAIIMHPLPRVDEIKYEVDNDRRAVYFKQIKYGKDIRSALLALILNKDLV